MHRAPAGVSEGEPGVKARPGAVEGGNGEGPIKAPVRLPPAAPAAAPPAEKKKEERKEEKKEEEKVSDEEAAAGLGALFGYAVGPPSSILHFFDDYLGGRCVMRLLSSLLPAHVCHAVCS